MICVFHIFLFSEILEEPSISTPPPEAPTTIATDEKTDVADEQSKEEDVSELA